MGEKAGRHWQSAESDYFYFVTARSLFGRKSFSQVCVTGKFSILVTADPGHFLKNGSGMEVRTIINLAEARCKPDKSTAQMYLSKI